MYSGIQCPLSTRDVPGSVPGAARAAIMKVAQCGPSES